MKTSPTKYPSKSVAGADSASLQEMIIGLRMILDQTGTYIFTKDTAGCYTYVNQMTQDLFGASFEDIVGRDDSHFFDLELANGLRLNDRRVIDFGETIEREETNLVKATGEVRIYWTVKKPLRNDQGQIIGLCGISTDITERKAMENALRESEAHLRQGQVGGGIGTWEADLVNNKQVWSENCMALLGCPAWVEPTWENFLSVVHTEDRQRVLDATQLHIESGAPYDVEYRAVAVDGNISWLRSVGQVERDADGKPRIMRGIVQDITERHNNQQRIVRLLAEQKSILDNQLVGICTARDRKVVWANAAYETMLGYGKGELTGKSTREFYVTEEAYQAVGAAYANIENDGILRTQHEFVRKDGRHIWLDLSAATLHMEAGESLWIFVDATERKQAEEQRAKSLSLLYATLESTNDAILVVDLNNTWILHNQRFIDLWQITGEILASKNDNTALIYVLNQLEDADAFLKKVLDLYATPEISSFDMLKFKNGKIIERYSIPQRVDGNVVGRVWSFRDVTERKRAEKLLSNSENKYRSLIDLAGDAIFLADTVTGIIVDCNRSATELLGKSKDEIIGSNQVELHPADKVSFYEKIFKNHIESGLDMSEDVLVVHKDGHTIPVDIHASVVTLDSSTVILGIFRDITKRKQQTDELNRTKKRYELATSIGRVGIWDWNCVTGDLVWNDEIFRIFGLEANSLSPSYEYFLAMVHQEDRTKIDKAVQEALHKKKGYGQCCRIILGNGDERICRATGEVEFNDAGEPVRMLGTFLDVTERKQIEEALRASEEQIRAITDNATTVIVLKDLAGKYLHVNRQFERVFHVSNAAIQGKTDHDIFPLELADAFIKNDQMAIQSGEVLEIEELVPHDDGMRTYISVKFPIRHNSGEIYAVCGMSTDITQRKQAEEELRIAATAFESQEGMLVTDASQVILRVNYAFTNITGYSVEDVLGQTPRILSSGLHEKEFFTVMWDSINSTGTWQGEIWNRRKNGEVYPEHLTITAVKDSYGIVTNYVASLIDITLTKAAADEIKNLAFYDPLTGLPNRRLLVDRLNQALAASARSGNDGALLFLDLDHFKTLNDSLGHDVGDMLLKQVAERLASCVREGDTVARLSGDEFVVLLEDLSEQVFDAAAQADAIGNDMLVALSQPYQFATHEYHSTSSIGATLFSGHEQAVDELLKQADIAMYHAKAAGRNALCFYDPLMQAAISARVELEEDLRQALAENQFELYFQAQVHRNHQIIGAEVLIRWQHPLRGMISPADFIPLAEETRLILPIGLWVLETACAQIKSWEGSEHTQYLQLAVNVSARQFYQADFVDQVTQALSRNAINPARLKLELTESLVLDDIDGTILKMNALRHIGVRFSMDDFGTGYSSLSSLKKLPLDQLKIDQSFVRDISIDLDGTIIVETIIAMANKLGIEVIAEGVETEAQRAFLEQHDCPLFQGYFFSKPVPIAQFEDLLKRNDSPSIESNSPTSAI
jgi:diguanylate cyclase (GGDEF)-like protein/PAS domain S-box-containing protein